MPSHSPQPLWMLQQLLVCAWRHVLETKRSKVVRTGVAALDGTVSGSKESAACGCWQVPALFSWTKISYGCSPLVTTFTPHL